MSGRRASAPREDLSDDVVLGALDRAVRHSTVSEHVRPRSALWHEVINHLALPVAGGAGTKRIRGPMQRLEDAGLVIGTPWKHTRYWTVSPQGATRIAELRAQGALELPESPQHREWRVARQLAFQYAERFLADLRADLEATIDLAQQTERPHSDEWFEAAERLARSAWRVGSTRHVLFEWPEPDDDNGPDVDTGDDPRDEDLAPAERGAYRRRRQSRRSYRYWTKEHAPTF